MKSHTQIDQRQRIARQFAHITGRLLVGGIVLLCGGYWANATPAAKAPATKTQVPATKTQGAQRTAPPRATPTTRVARKLIWTTLPVKYANGRTLVDLMRFLLGKEGQIRYSHDLNVIFIKDEPEQVKQIIALQKRLDIPHKQFKLKLYLVSAEYIKDKKPHMDPMLPKQLQSTLRIFPTYNHFRMQDAGFIQIANNQHGQLRLGGDQGLIASFSPKDVRGSKGQLSLRFSVKRLRSSRTAQGKVTFYRRTLLSTDIMTRVGHTLVVGASKINGRGQALIMIVKVDMQ